MNRLMVLETIGAITNNGNRSIQIYRDNLHQLSLTQDDLNNWSDEEFERFFMKASKWIVK